MNEYEIQRAIVITTWSSPYSASQLEALYDEAFKAGQQAQKAKE